MASGPFSYHKLRSKDCVKFQGYITTRCLEARLDSLEPDSKSLSISPFASILMHFLPRLLVLCGILTLLFTFGLTSCLLTLRFSSSSSVRRFSSPERLYSLSNLSINSWPGSRTARSIAIGRPRCRPLNITTISMSLLRVCQAPLKAYVSYGTPVLTPTVPNAVTVSKKTAYRSNPGEGIESASRSTMQMRKKAMKTHQASEAICFRSFGFGFIEPLLWFLYTERSFLIHIGRSDRDDDWESCYVHRTGVQHQQGRGNLAHVYDVHASRTDTKCLE